MDKISEGKDPSVFLLDDAEKSKENANRLRRLVWNDDNLRGLGQLLASWVSYFSPCIFSFDYL
jgi:hypothetical protein